MAKPIDQALVEFGCRSEVALPLKNFSTSIKSFFNKFNPSRWVALLAIILTLPNYLLFAGNTGIADNISNRKFLSAQSGPTSKNTEPSSLQNRDNNNSKFISELEAKVFELGNSERVQAGARPLVWSDDLAKLARLHAENMAVNRFFSHKDLEGKYVDDRAMQLGITNWMAIGENIAYIRGYDDPAAVAVKRWLLSAMHKQNLLNREWNQTGIGAAIAEDGTIYFTQVFILR